ncbi:LysR substrate-binding domain-containing protein [Nocardiopsis synnemataformans]|uniref:LysR substrate-binding domain-containing protein n=1 Tax=Nocardiopsis synnemataformans TaxID=61305 RepID=UPI003EBC5AD6
MEALPSAARGDEAGVDRIRVGILGAGLGTSDASEVLRYWRRNWPDVRLEHVSLSAENHDVAVLDGTVDIAVQQLGSAEPSELVTHVAYRTPRAVVVPSDSPYADAPVLDPGDLQDEDFLFTDVSGRLGEVWADLPVMEGSSRDTVVSTPASVAPAVFTTRRLGVNALAAQGLGVLPGTKFVELTGSSVDIGVAMRAGEQPPAVEALYRAVEFCTITGPLNRD